MALPADWNQLPAAARRRETSTNRSEFVSLRPDFGGGAECASSAFFTESVS